MDSKKNRVEIEVKRKLKGDFWLLAISEFLLSMSVYLLLPTMPLWLAGNQNLSAAESGLVMGAFGAGLFVLGFFVSFLWFVSFP